MEIDKGVSQAAARVGAPIEFRLDPASGVPTYLQLVHQVEHALRLGYLKPGDQLPKVRDVVSALAINPNTVLKAYRGLETKGLAPGRPGQGTFVQASLSQIGLRDLRRTQKGAAGLARHRGRVGPGRGRHGRALRQRAAGFLRGPRRRPDGAAGGQKEGVA